MSLRLPVQFILATFFLASIFLPRAVAEGLVVSSTNVSKVRIPGRDLRIYEDTQNFAGDNQNYPSRWLFAIPPMLIPDFDENGIPKLTTVMWSKDQQPGIGYSITTRIGLPLILSSSDLFTSAAAAMTEYYKTSPINYTVLPSQITTIPASTVDIAVFDLGAKSHCKLENKSVPIAGGSDSIILYFDCVDSAPGNYPKDLTSVSDFKRRLASLNASVTVTYNAKKADVGVVTFRTKDVKDTKLSASLAGDGSDVLVSRKDLRDLAMESAQELYVEYRGKQLKSDLYQSFVSSVLASTTRVTLEAQTFNREMLAHSYHEEDLNPNEITKTWDKTIEETSTKDKVNFATEGHGSLLDIASAGGSLSGEHFRDEMSKRDIEAEFDGKKWYAKSVNVMRFNTAKFAASFKGSITDITVDKASDYGTESWQLKFAQDPSPR